MLGVLGFAIERNLCPTAGPANTAILALVYTVLIVGGFVGHAEIVKLEPRVCKSFPILMSILDSGAVGILAPIGYMLRGEMELRKILVSSCFLSAILLVSNLFFIFGVGLVSVGTMSIVQQCTPAIAYPLEIIFLNKKCLMSKSIIILFGMIGLLLTLASSNSMSYGEVEPVMGFVFGQKHTH